MLIDADSAKRLKEQALSANSGTRFTRFLTPIQRSVAVAAARAAGVECGFYGGYPDAENTVCAFYPSWDIPQEYPVRCVFAACRDASALTHRDYMGAAMSLNIERSILGDFVPTESGCYIFCLTHAAAFLTDNLVSAGRFSVKCELTDCADVPVPAKSFEPLTINVGSPRLDSVLAALLRLDRESAKKLILSGVVTLNYAECLVPDKQISAGAVISARGYGKYIIDDTSGLSRKGRHFIKISKYK